VLDVCLCSSPDARRLFEDRYADPYLSYFIVSHSKVKQRWPDLWQFVDTATNAPPASTGLPTIDKICTWQ
jgi:hypothetical protein